MNLAFFVRVTSEPVGNQSYRSYSHVSINFLIFHDFAVVCGLVLKVCFSKNSFRNTIRVSNNLDPDQDQHYVGPDLSPSCFQACKTLLFYT